MPGAPPFSALEGVKLGIDFVKQTITISAQLATFVSGGIYFLVSQKVHVDNSWLYAVGLLFGSIVAGLFSIGSYIGQFRTGNLNVYRGFGRWMALLQVLLFLGALFSIVRGGFVGIGVIDTAQHTAPAKP